jgi:hypothetical protein
MKAKGSLVAVVFVLLTLAAFTTGCSQLSTRTDAQIASDVQSKINSDPTVTTKQITVQSGNGVVTLSGVVANDTERNIAANDAAQVRGVKTVVNNLTVGYPAAQFAEPPAPTPAPVPARVSNPAPRHASVRRPAPAPTSNQRVYQEPAPVSTMASNAPTNVTMAPAPPPPPVRVTVPDGTMLSVRLIDAINTEQNRPGDTFRATLDSPVLVDDRIVIPADADIQGRIAEARNAGHYAGQSQLALELTQVTVNGHSYPLRTDQFTRQGASRGSRTAKTVGGGAVLGAIIGGIAGGGKGAAIGAASGAGAGGAVQTVTKPEAVKLGSETVLSFRLTEPVTVLPFSTTDRNSERRRTEDDRQRSDRDRPPSDNDRPVLERRPTPPQN